MLAISKFLFLLFFTFFNNIANKTQLNNSREGTEILAHFMLKTISSHQ